MKKEQDWFIPGIFMGFSLGMICIQVLVLVISSVKVSCPDCGSVKTIREFAQSKETDEK